MEKKYNLFISCDEANHSCDKSQYNEASILEKIKLSVHLIHCKACQTYTKNNSKLTKLINNNDVHAMKSNEKESLEALFKKELSNNK